MGFFFHLQHLSSIGVDQYGKDVHSITHLSPSHPSWFGGCPTRNETDVLGGCSIGTMVLLIEDYDRHDGTWFGMVWIMEPGEYFILK